MRWLSIAILARIDTLAVLQLDIQPARETLATLEVTAWGVPLWEIAEERFVLPAARRCRLPGQSPLGRTTVVRHTRFR